MRELLRGSLLFGSLFPGPRMLALPHMGSRGHRGRRRYRSGAKLYKPNGKREVARRFRQIQAGQLKVTG